MALMPCSAADWARTGESRDRASVHAAGQLPILVGGTGLYCGRLLDGIAPVPPIDPEIRSAGARATGRGQSRRAARRSIPKRRRGSTPADTTRIARALEVVLSTGRTLTEWQSRARGRDRRRDRASAPDPPAAARLALRPLRRALRGDVDRGAVRKSSGCWRASSIPNCRSCARSACRNRGNPARRS